MNYCPDYNTRQIYSRVAHQSHQNAVGNLVNIHVIIATMGKSCYIAFHVFNFNFDLGILEFSFRFLCL